MFFGFAPSNVSIKINNVALPVMYFLVFARFFYVGINDMIFFCLVSKYVDVSR